MRTPQRWFIGMAAMLLPGCAFVPAAKFHAAEAENRALAEQNRVLSAEVENLRLHGRRLEDRVLRGEKQLAALHERADLDQRRLADYERERDELYRQFQALAAGGARLPTELGRQLEDLARRYPDLHFDAETGVAKLDTDILFDSGEAVLKAGAGQMLDDLVRVLKSPAAGDLKILVAGHTDNQPIVGRESRDKYPNNFHLSAARALAVADRMRRAGMPDSRLGVAGFGPSQPIASNATASDRQKNRRVELFVLDANAPAVGWTESIPSVYGAGVRR